MKTRLGRLVQCTLLAACLAVILGVFPAAAQNLSIATGGTGGMYYPYGGALASIWSKTLDDVTASVEVTGGSVINLAKIARGDSDVALSMADVALGAVNGTGKFKRPLPISALFVMYPNLQHLVTQANSDVHSVRDLPGKTVSIGAPGSGTAAMALEVLGALGISEDDLTVQRLNFNETANALRNGTIDAGYLVAGVGVAAVTELATTRNIRLIGLDQESLAAVNNTNSAYTGMEIPGNAYRGVEDPVTVATVWNVVLVRSDMSEELAYKLTRNTFENLSDLHKVSLPAKATTITNTLEHLAIPLHPGAAKYFAETGAAIPDRLVAN